MTLANVAAALETPLFSIGCQGYATNCTFKNVAHTTKNPSQAPPSQSPGNSDATTVRKAPESAKDSLTELERLRLENTRLRQEVERRRRADEGSSKTAAPRGETETPADETPTATSTSATDTPIGTPITPAIDPEVIQSDNSGLFIFIPKLRNRSRYFEMEMENRRLRRELNRTTQLLRNYEQVIRQSKQNEVAGAVGMLTGTLTTSFVHDIFGYTHDSALGNTLAAVAAIGAGELLSSANPGVASGLRYAGIGMLATDGLTRLYRYVHGSGSNGEQGSATRSKKRAPNFAFLGYMPRTVRPPPNVAKEVSVPTSQDVPESSSPSKAATPTETTDQGPETLATAKLGSLDASPTQQKIQGDALGAEYSLDRPLLGFGVPQDHCMPDDQTRARSLLEILNGRSLCRSIQGSTCPDVGDSCPPANLIERMLMNVSSAPDLCYMMIIH